MIWLRGRERSSPHTCERECGRASTVTGAAAAGDAVRILGKGAAINGAPPGEERGSRATQSIVPMRRSRRSSLSVLSGLKNRAPGGVVAIAKRHKLCRFPSPRAEAIVHENLKDIERTLGVAAHRKTALTTELLNEVLHPLDTSLHGRRDRALLSTPCLRDASKCDRRL